MNESIGNEETLNKLENLGNSFFDKLFVAFIASISFYSNNCENSENMFNRRYTVEQFEGTKL